MIQLLIQGLDSFWYANGQKPKEKFPGQEKFMGKFEKNALIWEISYEKRVIVVRQC